MEPRRSLVRTIVHVDLDAFYCSVEEQSDPTLRGRAFAVGGRPEERGVVASCSYAARARGVHSAMSMAAALRLCPQLIIVATRHSEYRAMSRRVMRILGSYTPLLEQISIDEAFLDVTQWVNDSGTTGEEIALQIQQRIDEELGLSCSVGVASNKMVAKIATDQGKASVKTRQSPHALCVVAPGQEAQFLAPLSVTALWGVGPKMAQRLNSLGVLTIGDLARRSQRDLAQRFGKNGHDLWQHAQGIDKREVVTERETKSISSETTFVRDVQDWETLHATLLEQAAHVAADLQKQKLSGTTIKLKLRWTDFSITTRQLTLPDATAQVESIAETATQLLRQLWLHEQHEQPVRLLGVGISGLSPIRQLGLFDTLLAKEPEPKPEPPASLAPPSPAVAPPTIAAPIKRRNPQDDSKRRQLEQVMAQLEARFGASVVHLGTSSPEE